MTMLRIGVIGTRWGLMHAGAFRAAGAEISAICGRSLERTRAVAKRAGVPLATRSIPELCAASELVVVASPDRLHAEHVRSVAAHGKHILCEKPLVHDVEDAAEMAALAAAGAARGQLFLACFPYRFIPMVQRFRAALLGPPAPHWLSLAFHSSFANLPPAGPGAPVRGESGDLGGASHAVDLALWLSSARPLWVQAHALGRPAHSLALHLGLDNEVTVAVQHVATAEPGISVRIDALGGLQQGAGAPRSASPAARAWEASATLAYRPELRGLWAETALRRAGGAIEHLYLKDPTHPGPDVEPWLQVEKDLDRAFAEPHRDDWAEAHLACARAVLAAVAQRSVPAPLATFGEGALVQQVLGAALRSSTEQRRIAIAQP